MEHLKKLLVPYPEEQMEMFAVPNKSEDSPSAIEKIEFEVPSAPALRDTLLKSR